jgi:hypothetical protein
MEQPAEMQDSEVATAAEEPTKAVDTSSSPEDVIEETPETTAPELDADGEEIEYEGEKYKVPKTLKEAFLRQQDYTQKTQTLAEQRKAVDAERVEIQQRAQMQQQYVQEVAEAISLDKQLEQYGQIDWNALYDSDPVQAMKLDRQMRELQAQRDGVVSNITAKQRQQAMDSQQATAKQLQEAMAVVAREIPNWSPETAKALNGYGQTLGYAAQELANLSDPRAVKLLHKAYMYDQLVAKQSVKPKPEPQEKPVTRIAASKATATKSPGEMTDKEFAEFRRRQISKR